MLGISWNFHKEIPLPVSLETIPGITLEIQQELPLQLIQELFSVSQTEISAEIHADSLIESSRYSFMYFTRNSFNFSSDFVLNAVWNYSRDISFAFLHNLFTKLSRRFP